MAAAGSDARPFVGRAEAVDALRRRLDEARGGRGGLSLVVGDVGVGKSALLRLVASESAERGMAVLTARPGALEPAPPLQLIRDVLARGPTDRPFRGPGEGPGASLASMVPTTPTSAGLIGFAAPADGWAMRGSPGDERLLDATTRGVGEPGAAHARTFHALAEEFRRLVERGPTVVILENLHRADDASLEFLLYALPALARHPIWFVASSVPLPQLPEARRAWFDRLVREGGAEPVPLRPLTPQEVPELLEGLALAADASAEEIAKWHAQSGGNPLFLERLLRGRGAPGPVAPAAAPPTGEGPEASLLASLPP